MTGSPTIIGSSLVPIRLVFLMWLTFVIDYLYGFDLSWLGIFPRTLLGSIGIITAPLVHANPFHLISNTFPLLFLGMTLFYSYRKIASKVFFRCYFITNLLVWIFGRPSIHVGASGLIYGLASFLILFGFLRKDFRSFLISLLVLILYGSIFYGILPGDENISWESHLSGVITGSVAAFQFRKVKL